MSSPYKWPRIAGVITYIDRVISTLLIIWFFRGAHFWKRLYWGCDKYWPRIFPQISLHCLRWTFGAKEFTRCFTWKMKRGLRNGPAFLRTSPVYPAFKKRWKFLEGTRPIHNWKKTHIYLVPGSRPATNQQKPVGNPNLDDDKALRTKTGETRKPMTNHDQAWWLDLQGCWNKPIKVWCHRMMGPMKSFTSLIGQG